MEHNTISFKPSNRQLAVLVLLHVIFFISAAILADVSIRNAVTGESMLAGAVVATFGALLTIARFYSHVTIVASEDGIEGPAKRGRDRLFIPYHEIASTNSDELNFLARLFGDHAVRSLDGKCLVIHGFYLGKDQVEDLRDLISLRQALASSQGPL